MSESLKAEARAVGGVARRSLWLGKALVAGQMAFCLLLLVVAGLFVRSLRALTSAEIGFDRTHVVAARVDVRSLGYSDSQRQALYDRIIARLEAVPGVVSASLSQNGPLVPSSRIGSLSVEGFTAGAGERLRTNEEVVTERYFSTVGLSVLRGRSFGPEDRAPGARTTLINETFARRFFAGQDPIGKRWNYGGPIGPESFVIVGVVEDAKYRELKEPSPNMVYRLSAAADDQVLADLEVKTSGDPQLLVATIRQVLSAAESQLPVIDVLALSERLSRVIAQDSVIAQLTSIFGGIALLLACLGLYGTISYGVTQRIGELGLRIALGADRHQVLWLVMREALVVVLMGGLVGLPLTFIVGGSLATLLYSVPPVDPVAYGVGAMLLVAVAVLAAYLPAHRAARIEPIRAITQQ